MAVTPFDSPWKQAFRRRLRRWYAKHRRELPWRQSQDPYRVWVSEVMLQQTTVSTVRGYFDRFIARFPDVKRLAAADEQEVLSVWEGLGYYRRARQMHAAANCIVAEHGGAFPRTVTELQRLPGIGRYTAGAIASIAFDQPAPILEANTQRLYARLSAFRGELQDSRGQRHLWGVAEDLVPRARPGEFNQALMELGSLVCTPREPNCAECPVSTLCRAVREGVVGEIPRPKARTVYTSLHEIAVVVTRGSFVLVRQCQAGERWEGLWDVLRMPAPPKWGEPGMEKNLQRDVAKKSGLSIETPQYICTIRHGVTRYRITLDCYVAQAENGTGDAPLGDFVWIAAQDLNDYPLHTTARKVADTWRTQFLESNSGAETN